MNQLSVIRGVQYTSVVQRTIFSFYAERTCLTYPSNLPQLLLDASVVLLDARSCFKYLVLEFLSESPQTLNLPEGHKKKQQHGEVDGDTERETRLKKKSNKTDKDPVPHRREVIHSARAWVKVFTLIRQPKIRGHERIW